MASVVRAHWYRCKHHVLDVKSTQSGNLFVICLSCDMEWWVKRPEPWSPAREAVPDDVHREGELVQGDASRESDTGRHSEPMPDTG